MVIEYIHYSDISDIKYSNIWSLMFGLTQNKNKKIYKLYIVLKQSLS